MMKEEQNSKGMTIIVKTVTRWVMGFILIFGLYGILYGHHSPGGGFSGGVILASAFILLMLAFGKEKCMRFLRRGRSVSFASTGVLIFLGIGLLGIPLGGYFLANFLFKEKIGGGIDLLSAGTIQPIDIGIALLVSLAIFLIFAYLSFHRVVVKEDKREMKASEAIGEE